MELPSVLGKRSQPEPSPEASLVSTTSTQISHPLHWRAIQRIDQLSAAAQITVTEVEKLQKETLNPLIDNLLDRSENDAGRQQIYQKLTALNQRLRKDDLPTVRLDRLSTLPDEVFAEIIFLKGRLLPRLSRGVERVQQSSIEHMTQVERNMKEALGDQTFEHLRRVCHFLENADVITRVTGIYKTLQRIAREYNRGKDPVFSEEFSPYSVEAIARLNDYFQKNHTLECNRGVVALVGCTWGLRQIIENDQVKSLPLERQAQVARTVLADNQEIVTTLERLRLERKALKVIPPEIGQFKALTSLCLSGNKIEVIPPEIGQLTALTFLHLSNNQIEVIPSEIGQLTALKRLWIYFNQIEVIPPEIRKLTALTELHLSNNKIQVIPPEIGYLIALAWLGLVRNKIEVIPPELKRAGLRISI